MMRNQLNEMNEIGETEEIGEYGHRRYTAVHVADDRPGRSRVRRMPYDYVARFPLTGMPGRKVIDVINISAEARFVCYALSYSLEIPSVIPDLGPTGPVIMSGTTRRNGNPVLSLTRYKNNVNLPKFVTGLDLDVKPQDIQGAVEAEQLNALQIQAIYDALSFKYAMIDKGSGRELQNEPIHNLAGLGRPDGTRPFRELLVPYIFEPNSSVLIEIEEIVTPVNGIINMDFQGYKEFR